MIQMEIGAKKLNKLHKTVIDWSFIKEMQKRADIYLDILLRR